MNNTRPQAGGAPDRIVDKQSYRAFLAADLQAHDLRRWRWWLRFRHPCVHYQRVLRRVEWLASRRGLLARSLWALHRIRLATLSVRTGISIPPGVFGPGLSIAHYGSIVVNDGARVGSFCRIHSGTNIGTYRGAAPSLGDYVYLGPGAVLYGGISIGDYVAVGANSVVGKDVPPHVTVVGAGKVLPDSDSRSVLPDWMIPDGPPLP